MARGDINEAVNAKKTREERKASASKAGKASGKVRRIFKSMREYAMEIGSENVPQTKTAKAQAVVDKMYLLAAKGNVQAAALLLKMRGEDIQRVEVDGNVPVQVVDDCLGE